MDRLQNSPIRKNYINDNYINDNYKIFYIKRDKFNNVIFIFKPYLVVIFAIFFSVFTAKITKYML